MQVSKKPIELISMDLSCQQSANELFQRAEDWSLDLEYLENNAGFGNFGNVQDLPHGKTEINTIEHRHAYRPYKTLLAKMLQQRRGRIFNIVNTRAFQPNPNVLAYAASKAYVLHYSE